MTVADWTGIITSLTALVVAVGGALTAARLLREVKTGNQLTQAGNDKTDAVHVQLNSAKEAADRYEEDLRTALQTAGVTIPHDKSLERHDAIQESKER